LHFKNEFLKGIRMAKTSKNPNNGASKTWREAELIQKFQLEPIVSHSTALLDEWLTVQMPVLTDGEQYVFDTNLLKAQKSLRSWSEEDLKVKFIGNILELGHLTDDDNVVGYFDKIISATVEGTYLTVKSDFMLAKGFLNVFETPYFHFQEYKPHLNPSGEPMAQLLEAFLIAQVKNKNQKPMYGVEIVGATWRFVVMEGKKYVVSKTFDSVDKGDLLKIIAILRKFRWILQTYLLT
jgi:hypothetical protein